jgi:hypothetical protein
VAGAVSITVVGTVGSKPTDRPDVVLHDCWSAQPHLVIQTITQKEQIFVSVVTVSIISNVTGVLISL